jgi:L-ascorbate metabolism protein UlaG (beta-lactamase superfamily)
MLENVEFLGHASFRIKGSKTVYIDPYQLESNEPADIIFITHSHFDHLSLEDVKKIAGKDTVVVCSKDCVEQVKPLVGKVIGIDPFERTHVGEVLVESVPAYNINKEYHPRANNWNGYVFTLDGVRYYHPGDTDRIPEMGDVRTDVAFLPVGGTYTMDCDEAAEAVELINPTFAVPMHYGSIVGSDSDAKRFAQLVGERAKIIPKGTN